MNSYVKTKGFLAAVTV